MKLFKYLPPIILLLVYALIFILFCYTLFPAWGHIPALYLIGSTVALCIILGDRIILALVKAERRASQNLRDRIDNLCYRLGAQNVALYTAPGLTPGVYSLRGIGGNASLIVGGNITKLLSAEEVEALFYLAVLRIKVADLRFIQMCNAALFVLKGPCKYLGKFRWFKYPMIPWTFSLLPLINIQLFITNMEQKLSDNILNTVSDRKTVDSIKSAHFKLLHLNLKRGGIIEYFLLYHLSTVETNAKYGHYQSSNI